MEKQKKKNKKTLSFLLFHQKKRKIYEITVNIITITMQRDNETDSVP